jgi:hypothetical protein
MTARVFAGRRPRPGLQHARSLTASTWPASTWPASTWVAPADELHVCGEQGQLFLGGHDEGSADALGDAQRRGQRELQPPAFVEGPAHERFERVEPTRPARVGTVCIVGRLAR